MSSFQASATYDGPREGYAFKTGPEGVAYYKDSGDGGHGLEADVQMQELEREQEELDAAEGWLPYSTNNVSNNINTTEQSSWAPTSHVLVVNCEATKATISATIKAIPVHRYPLSPFEL